MAALLFPPWLVKQNTLARLPLQREGVPAAVPENATLCKIYLISWSFFCYILGFVLHWVWTLLKEKRKRSSLPCGRCSTFLSDRSWGLKAVFLKKVITGAKERFLKWGRVHTVSKRKVSTFKLIQLPRSGGTDRGPYETEGDVSPPSSPRHLRPWLIHYPRHLTRHISVLQ